MLDLITLEFSDVSVALVGPQNRLKGIKAYCDYCDRNGLPINFDNMVGRIIDNKVFVRIEGKTIKARLEMWFRGYSKKLRKSSLDMSFCDFIEASCIVCPEKAKVLFELKDEELTSILDNTVWKMRYPEYFTQNN